MLAIRLKSELEERLACLAKKTGSTRFFYAREAIELHLTCQENYHLVADAARNPARACTPEQAKSELGL